MAQSRFRAYRVWVVVSLLVAGMLSGVGSPPASADVTAVTGSAYGYSLNVSLFNQPQPPVAGTPSVALPAAGSATPLTDTAPSGRAQAGPAVFFTSGQLDVSTQGTTGANGSVTSSVDIANITNTSGEVFAATALRSSCTASEAGVTGSTTITGGTLQTDSGDDDPTNTIPDHAPVTVAVPANPAPGTEIEGHIHINGATDNFRYVFNEQVTNPDGSITVNAAHQYLLGPTATGDLIIGQVVCGVTASASPTTTAAPGGPTTTAAPGGPTTTAAPRTPTTVAQAPTTVAQTPPPTQAVTAQQTNTTAASTNTTAAPASTEVGGGAYGFFVSIGLFGGAPASRGPTPTVTLPSGGSATPVTDSAPSGNAQFGPAIIFTSDKLDVSTEGTPGGTVTSSATANNVNRSGQEQLTAATVSSKCTSSGTEQSGSTTVTGGKLVTSSGANTDSDALADDTVVDLPANPAPNTPYEGKVEAVGDTFRVVLNEQVKTAGGITVNAVHMFLLGPTAVGELIIGQSRCGTTGGGAGGSGGGGGAGGGGGGAGGGSGLAGTGSQGAVFVALALLLMMAGWTATFWTVGNGRRGQWAIPASWSARVSWPPHRNLR